MTSNTVSHSDTDREFVLKHRIVGAAFLLFFGALFLPWLLGAPSQATKVSSTNVKASDSSLSSTDIENELLEAIENEQIIDAEKVYISKITPLDAKRAAEQAESEKQQPVSEGEKSAAPVKAPPNVLKNPASESSSTNSPSGTTTAAVVPKDPPVEVGWIVQVGLFENKKGAARVISDLKKKGFKPRTTVVDTNRGKATGTRVWLGPYAQRVDAAKTKNRLSEKTGVAGFIRAYP